MTRLATDFEAFIQDQLLMTTTPGSNLVPETELWGVADRTFVGRISIRHELNDALRVVGGHIGYDTARKFRGRGLATEMLRLALPIAKSLGLARVLLTCDDTNVPSIKVIEANAGVLEGVRANDPNKPRKRYYWIDLQTI